VRGQNGLIARAPEDRARSRAGARTVMPVGSGKSMARKG